LFVPIYEYVCQACEHRFETIVFGNRQPECPSCASTALDKQLSAFAVNTGGESFDESPAPCGQCGDPRGAGACTLN
jgi:putative FmdB family regulatory protein